MIKAILIDDAEKARAALRSDIQNYCPDVFIAGEADGVAAGIEAIKTHAPDLVFLDIRMNDGTGFDLLERLEKENKFTFKVIFTTAYNEYAIKAFRFSALDYLLKPVDPEELVMALNKIKKGATTNVLGEHLNLLMENLKGLQASEKRIALNSLEKVQIVNVSEIIHCESQKNYTIFYLLNKQQVLVTKTLKEYEELLGEYNFLRVHHSHLINLKQLKEYVKMDGGYAVMCDGSQVPVSVRKKDQLLKMLGL